jgi:hypothetical protein
MLFDIRRDRNYLRSVELPRALPASRRCLASCLPALPCLACCVASRVAFFFLALQAFLGPFQKFRQQKGPVIAVMSMMGLTTDSLDSTLSH